MAVAVGINIALPTYISMVWSTKVICPQNLFLRKSQRTYLPGPTVRHVLLTVARTRTISDKITIFCNDVNKTSTSVKLLAINILRYMS